MANVLVYIQTEGVGAEPASLEALGEARRIASTLGGTLYAVAIVDAEPGDCAQLIATLGKTGADRVTLVRSADDGAPNVWATRGAALTTAAKRLHPNLVLMSGDASGRDIAPRLAAKLGASYFAEPAVQYGSHGEVVLSRATYGGTHRERLSAEDLKGPAVATLTPGSYKPARGQDDTEVLSLDTEPVSSLVTHLETLEDEGSDLDRARVIVCAGAGCNAKARALATELASALGGAAAATRTAVTLGHASEARMVDIGGRNVAPALYIACGSSGSMSHLGAVASDAEIVAINSDANAPIFRVASYGIVGDASDVLSQMLEANSKRSEAT